MEMTVKQERFLTTVWLMLIVLAAWGLVGCSALENKAVVVDSDIYGFKATMGADPTSGSITPSLAVGSGGNLLIDLPTDSDGTLEYEKSSGSWFGEVFGVSVTDTVKVRMTSGDSKVTITTTTDQTKEVTTEVGDGRAKVNVKDRTVVAIPSLEVMP